MSFSIQKMIFVIVYLLVDIVFQTSAEFCPSIQQYCNPPNRCCVTRCCTALDNARQNDDYHITVYRWNVWNMWYFWFIIVFIMVSCFGGCGYYKRRQMMLARNHGTTVSYPSQRTGRGITETRPMPAFMDSYFHAYTGPAAEPQSPPPFSYMPPAYTEVVSKPDMYPVNKIEVPPYPGTPAVHSDAALLAANERQLTLNAQALPHNDSSTAQNNIQPPPYSSTVPAATNQIAMQSNATNQNSSHIPVETNQVLPSENTVA